MLRIIVANDYAIVRRGIIQVLNEALEIAEIIEARNANDTMTLVRQGIWDLLILDISMPGRSGLEVLQEVRDHRPQPRILMLSIHPEDLLAQRMLRAGASGYLTIESTP